MNKKILVFAFIAIGIFSIGLMLFLSPKIWPYSPDSASYIDAARHLKAGNGLVISKYGIAPVDADITPLRLWPPGYPLLICSLSLLGIKESFAAVLVPRIFFIFLPFAFFLTLRNITGDKIAFFSAIGASFMEGLIRSTLMAWSEIPFLFMVLISMTLLFKSIKKDSFWYAIAAGIAAGFALAIRNVGYALIASVAVGLTLAPFLKLLTWKAYFKEVFLYGLGFFVSFLPFAIRNILTFHSIQPYSLPPSDLTFIYNVKAYCWELTRSFLGNDSYTRLFILFLLISTVFVAVIFIKRRNELSVFKKTYSHRIVFGLIVILYAAFGSFLVILARSIYKWGEGIGFRHLIQYNWIFLVYFLFIAHFLFKKVFKHFLKTKLTALILLTFCFLIMQLIFLLVWFSFSNDENTIRMRRLYKLKGVSAYISALPQDTYIISNEGPNFRILTGRNIRQLRDISPEELAAKVSGVRDLVVVIANYRPRLFKYYNLLGWLPVLQGCMPEGYKYVLNEDDVVVLSYDKLNFTKSEI